VEDADGLFGVGRVEILAQEPEALRTIAIDEAANFALVSLERFVWPTHHGGDCSAAGSAALTVRVSNPGIGNLETKISRFVGGIGVEKGDVLNAPRWRSAIARAQSRRRLGT
jgi:hypothetical protein